MKHSPITRAFRATVALVAVAAWFHASNHCAIGELLPKPAPAAEHAACHASEVPAEDEEGGTCVDLSCCSSLSAPAQPLAKSFSDQLAQSGELEFVDVTGSPLRGEHEGPIAELDTGPPKRDSFAESVLQRSLLAHAPPLFA